MSVVEGLLAAIEAHDAASVRALLAAGADPNGTSAAMGGLPPLHAAIDELAFGGSLDIVADLINHGADVNAWDADHHMTPLLRAVAESQRHAVELLVARGADPNSRSDEGQSPLHMSVAQGDLDVAALLLSAGAKRTIDAWETPTGLTPLGLAASRLEIEMIRLLVGAGACLTAHDENGCIALERLPPSADSQGERWDEAARLLAPPPGETG